MLKRFFNQGNLLNGSRILVGIAGIICGVALDVTKSLQLALILFGAFALVHTTLDWMLQQLKTSSHVPDGYEGGLRDFASSFVATSAVILGLLAVFDGHKWGETIDVGVAALTADILFGVMLVGLLLAGAASSDGAAWNLIRYVFNIAVWGLTLGLLCIAMGLLYR